ncbi:RsmD family RNA methyltransferase [Alkalihalobacillus oceani]|uniref:TRM11 family SAM-dependent methyltransferase n=1 Tax=Halalkalibacter oceani TaxID=1653776 RepID=UPI00203DEF60|nr:RsmD family RNA methyltransferase [Halalkalibacter oceani]MCM3761451.1 RsmD family RNA methyltransferase [Halalkalibacter oceani]
MKTEKNYIYLYAYHDDDEALAKLEMRSLFGADTDTKVLQSQKEIAPERSPFIRGRIDIIVQAESFEDLLAKADRLVIEAESYKVTMIKNDSLPKGKSLDFQERRRLERGVGSLLRGTVDLDKPERIVALLRWTEGWLIGYYEESQSIWLRHQHKPEAYSTALSTRVARAVVNIAVPEPQGVKVIDPCCGAGTVLIEALSMGIEMDGGDINPLVARKARKNVAHFGYECPVRLRDIREVREHYDVAIIDMPYNLCSVLSPEVKREMLEAARAFTDKLVVVTVEELDPFLREAGFQVTDRALAKKGRFVREIIVCR